MPSPDLPPQPHQALSPLHLEVSPQQTAEVVPPPRVLSEENIAVRALQWIKNRRVADDPQKIDYRLRHHLEKANELNTAVAVRSEAARSNMASELPERGLEPTTWRQQGATYRASRRGNRIINKVSSQIRRSGYGTADAVGRPFAKEDDKGKVIKDKPGSPDGIPAHVYANDAGTPEQEARLSGIGYTPKEKASRYSPARVKAERRVLKLNRKDQGGKLFGVTATKGRLKRTIEGQTVTQRFLRRRANQHLKKAQVMSERARSHGFHDRAEQVRSTRDKLRRHPNPVIIKRSQEKAKQEQETTKQELLLESHRAGRPIVTEDVDELLKSRGFTAGIKGFMAGLPETETNIAIAAKRAMDFLTDQSAKGKLKYEKVKLNPGRIEGHFTHPTRHKKMLQIEEPPQEGGGTEAVLPPTPPNPIRVEWDLTVLPRNRQKAAQAKVTKKKQATQKAVDATDKIAKRAGIVLPDKDDVARYS